MRTRFLSVIVGFLLVSMAITSCLDSDNEVTEYSSDATIHAFSLDTIHGVDYKFEIDQLNNLIYNPDSLPVDADTLIDSIQVDQLSVMWGVMSGDTAFNVDVYHNLLSAMNAGSGNGVKLTAYAPDGVTTRDYTLQIRVHRQVPDSLTWVHMDTVADVFSQAVNAGEQKAVLLNDELLLYTSPSELYRTSAAPSYSLSGGQYGWRRSDVAGLPAQVDITSLIVFADNLYMLAEGDVYVSQDAVNWQKSESLSGGVQVLVACLPSNEVSDLEASLVAIRLNAAGGKEFCKTTDGLSWTTGSEVPEGFPTSHLYYVDYTTGGGAAQVLVMGMPRNGEERTIPWFSNDGLSWASLDTDAEGVSCPGMDNPVLIYYNEHFYAFGGSMNAIYESKAGIAWQQVEENFLLPSAFAGKDSYTVVVDHTPKDAFTAVDKRDFIWVIFGGNGIPNEVWRGRLNKLGFERE